MNLLITIMFLSSGISVCNITIQARARIVKALAAIDILKLLNRFHNVISKLF